MSATAQRSNGRGPRVPIAPTPDPFEPAPAPAPGTPQLDAAVLLVQAAAPTLVRNAIGQIQHRTYGYVTLDAVVDVVLPLLVEHDLVWKTFPTVVEGEPALRYRMTHIPSGQYDEDTMVLMCAMPNPQGQGSAITYARRYALTAYLQLTVDPDDDGRAATPNSQAGNEGEGNRAAAAPAQPTAAPAQPSVRAATAKQRGMLQAKARAAGLGPADFANVVLVAIGDPPRAWSDENHADQTLKRELERLPWNLVDAVIAGIAGAAA